MSNVIKGPWRGPRTAEDVEFINAVENALQRRLVMIHGSISNTPIEDLEALDEVMTILDRIYRTGP